MTASKYKSILGRLADSKTYIPDIDFLETIVGTADKKSLNIELQVLRRSNSTDDQAAKDILDSI